MINRLAILFVSTAMLVACSEQDNQSALAAQPSSEQSANQQPSFEGVGGELVSQSAEKPKQVASGDYKTIEWTDLIPKDDLDALLNPPDYLMDIVDGSAEDVIDSQLKSKSSEKTGDRYQQALSSKEIKPEFNNQKIRIPGFIVPLEFDEYQTVTTFFIVPFFGACLHSPPPPPNQIIFSDYEQGFKLETLYDPFWFEGTVITAVTENGIATSAYAMNVDTIKPYEE